MCKNASLSQILHFNNFRFSPRAVVGEIDEDLDKRVNYSIIRAESLKPIVH